MRLPLGDAEILAERIDPVLLRTIVSFLRTVYPASDPAANSVLERVVRLTSGKPEVVERYQEGAKDPVTQWFESEHDYAAFRGRGAAMIELIVVIAIMMMAARTACGRW